MTSICVSFSIILISTLLATLRQIKLFRCCFQLFSYLSRFRNLPYDLLFLLILIFVFVSWILIRSMSHLYSKKRNSCVRVANLIWTISTCILLISSFSSCLVEIVYCMDQEAHVHMVDHPAPAPTVSETKERLRDFLSSFGKRRAYSSFINRISEELDLEHASPQKRGAILQIINNLSQRRGQSGLNSGQNAAAQLTMLVVDWEKNNQPNG